MIRDDALKTLMQFQGGGSPVLSLYLNVDQKERNKTEIRVRARQLLEQDGADQDAARVEEFLRHEYDWKSRGLAIFSCQSKDFWQIVRLPVPVIDSATVSERPYLRQLNEVLGSQTRIGVALVDRKTARYFGILLGAMDELGAENRGMIRRHKQQGPSPKLQRAADEEAQQNLKQAAQDAAVYFKAYGADQVVLAGQDEQVATLREYLPKAWQEKVIAHIPMDTEASPAQVLKKVNAVTAELEDKRQADLVQKLVNMSEKRGAKGVLGLADTLNALMEKQVMTLVTLAGYTAKGYECENCGFLSATRVDPCPACGGKMRRVDHLVDLAIRKAFDSDAGVESIRAEAAGSQLRKLGGIGAFLRF